MGRLVDGQTERQTVKKSDVGKGELKVRWADGWIDGNRRTERYVVRQIY
jgi:hypothetical protein